jgi:hypothetical protein
MPEDVQGNTLGIDSFERIPFTSSLTVCCATRASFLQLSLCDVRFRYSLALFVFLSFSLTPGGPHHHQKKKRQILITYSIYLQ